MQLSFSWIFVIEINKTVFFLQAALKDYEDALIDDGWQNGTRIDLGIHDRGLGFSHDVEDSARAARILSGFLPKGAVPVTRKSSQMFARNPSPLAHEKRGPRAPHASMPVNELNQPSSSLPSINKDLLRNHAIPHAAPAFSLNNELRRRTLALDR